MSIQLGRHGLNKWSIFAVGALLFGAPGVFAKSPVKTKVRKILVLDQNPSIYSSGRRDLNAALRDLAVEKGFAVTTIGWGDTKTAIATEFSPAALADYQAVLFNNSFSVVMQLDAVAKANLEAYVKDGGGLIPVHGSSDGILNWPWYTSVLVEEFGSWMTRPSATADVIHDAEGMRPGTETLGIFKGLPPSSPFMDSFITFRASPRGKPGVNILLRVDEATSSERIRHSMGSDHPVAWTKTEGKGRVVHVSLGHSGTANAYTEANGFLKLFLYGALRYVAGDFVGCTDNGYAEYNPDATKSDASACRERVPTAVTVPDGGDAGTFLSRQAGEHFVKVTVRFPGRHAVSMVDVAGRPVHSRRGAGFAEYSLPVPSKSGIYVVVSSAGGKESRFRISVL